MTAVAWPVVSVAEMRRLEAAAFDSGISEAALQARAAQEIARATETIAPAQAALVVLVGPGNNGRDAFLAGRILARRGRLVRYFLGPHHAVRLDELDAVGPPLQQAHEHAGPGSLSLLEGWLAQSELVLDGLLGIGLHGPMRPPLDEIARTVNRSAAASARVVSVDVPSGVDADSGAVPGEAIRADWTIALGGVKAGCLRFPAASLVGRLMPRPIGLPPGADAECRVRLLTPKTVAALVPPRPLAAHKGTLGWVLVVGGSREYVGAPILSAAAAARSGCGLVALAVPPNAQGPAASALPEATYLLRDDNQSTLVQLEQILGRLKDSRAMVVGPGLGRGESSTALVRGLLSGLRTLEQAPRTVVDADALTVLADWPDWWARLPNGCVLTPHFGEMARLTGLEAAAIAGATWELGRRYAAEWQQIVVLKGPLTVVAAPDGNAWVHPRANPALATAGSGDVLAGLVAGLAAQGLEPFDAARLAVVVHGLAAGRAVAERGWRSLIASDLLPMLPAILAELDG